MDWQSESPGLWAFLESLHRGEILSGTVAAIERFGVFVALDDGPDHPMFPGVGFITTPELSWRHIGAPTDVVEVGQRVSCEFLQFDTHNAEARLSLRALLPDPFQAFADGTVVGQTLRGMVVKVLPFGAFVDVGNGVVGLVPFKEVHGRPAARLPEAFQVGDEMSVVVTDVERPQRRVFLSRPEDVRHAGVVPLRWPLHSRLVSASMGRGDLTDAEWERLRPFLPVSNGRCGRGRDHRQVIDGILHPGADRGAVARLPARFGP